MVDLFFVLSGFVIYHNYSQKISSIKDILKFMFLRLGRLYPLHLFYLLIFLGVEIVKYISEPRIGLMPHETDAFAVNNMTSFMANLLLIQPFFSSTNITFNAPSWSIGVEFYTYLVFAFIVLVFPGKRKFTFASCFAVSLGLFLLSFWMWAGLSSDAGINFLRCILGFFAGTLAYQAYSSYGSYIARWSEAIMWVATIFLFFFLSLHSNSESDFIVLPFFCSFDRFGRRRPFGGRRVNVNFFELDSIALDGCGLLFDLHGSLDNPRDASRDFCVRTKTLQSGCPQLDGAGFRVSSGIIGAGCFSIHI